MKNSLLSLPKIDKFCNVIFQWQVIHCILEKKNPKTFTKIMNLTNVITSPWFKSFCSLILAAFVRLNTTPWRPMPTLWETVIWLLYPFYICLCVTQIVSLQKIWPKLIIPWGFNCWWGLYWWFCMTFRLSKLL